MVNPKDPLYSTFKTRIAKQFKPHLISRNQKVVGNSLSIGNPGYCKTTGNRREVELRYGLGHKIFCLYDAGRLDMSFFMFPSVSPFWKKPKLHFSKIVTARSYPTEPLIPITSHIPKRLPNCFRPFTIAVSDLTEEDLVALVGEGSKDTIRAAWEYMKIRVNKKTTANDYIQLLTQALNTKEKDQKISHFGPRKLIDSVFRPLLNQGLLSSKNASTAIDVKEIMKDKRTISTLVLRHCPKNLWGFLVHFFMNHINKHLGGFEETKRMKIKTTIVLNEVADLLADDEEKSSAAYSVRKMIGNIAKQSRTVDIFLLMDTQLPSELPDVKDTMSRIYVYNSSLASITRAMQIIGISQAAGDISSDDYALIPRLDRGWYYLFDRTSGVSIHKLMWLRSRTYLDGDDFYEIYDKIFGKTKYQNIRPLLDELAAEKKESEYAWKNIKKEQAINKPVRITKKELDINAVKIKEQAEENARLKYKIENKSIDWEAYARQHQLENLLAKK